MNNIGRIQSGDQPGEFMSSTTRWYNHDDFITINQNREIVHA